MKKSAVYLFLNLVWSCAMCHAAGASEKVTIVADNSYPPYSYMENGALKGIYPTILRSAFAMMEGYQVTLVARPWKRALREIREGKAFAIIPPYYRPDKRPYIGRYSLPVLEEKTVVVCREGIFKNDTDADWPQDFDGLTIAINRGFEIIDQAELRTQGVKNITLESGDGNEQNLLKLLQGRVPCYANDEISIRFGLQQILKKGFFDFESVNTLKFGPTISKERGYLGYSAAHPSFEKNGFIGKFDQVLLEMKEAGVIAEIVWKYVQR
ncbi:transporter substrate-binding domain-containing protein [Terasakiella sp. A23]|uniref:substrate-binding periplasmic protein n=1 Tax=Terasakiella sp. FCG-A23 TaxID=3080561 RepID=UPI0029542265|nr:transporter substrate-binding domain-containing protein [Terasakiella sp. A23]MDV7341477.1 transporter substrate-binding domain-containing protein [Terasakiella sp. A23]